MKGYFQPKLRWLHWSLIIILLLAFGWVIWQFRLAADVVSPSVGFSSQDLLVRSAPVGFVPGEAIVRFKTPIASTAAAEALLKKSPTAKPLLKKTPIQAVESLGDGQTIKISFRGLAPPPSSTSTASPQAQPDSRFPSQPAGVPSQKPWPDLQTRNSDVTTDTNRADRLIFGQTYRLIQKLAQDPQVRFAQPNYIYYSTALPNDTYLNPSEDGTTWSTGTFGQDYEDLWGLRRAGTDQAWERSKGANLIVAVIDTGIDYNHPDLAENVLWSAQPLPTPNDSPSPTTSPSFPSPSPSPSLSAGYNFTSPDPTDIMDRFGHGTHVAGIVAALQNNREGISGVAPEVKIMPVKVLGDDGYGTDIWISQGIRYAVDHGARILNLSLGGPGSSALMDDAISYAYERGAVIVVAAGNENQNLQYTTPANNPKVVSVAAFDEQDHLTFFSNFGPGLKLAAPGGSSSDDIYNILSLRSAVNDIPENLTVGDRYARLAGTSMAAPFVAGTAALVWSAHPTYTARNVESVLYRSATDLTNPRGADEFLPGWDLYSGYGLINPPRALETEPVDLPIAQLAGPRFDLYSSKAINLGAAPWGDKVESYPITGMAGGSRFSSYTVSWGAADLNKRDYFPTDWQELITTPTPVTNSVLAKLPKAILDSTTSSAIGLRLEVKTSDDLVATHFRFILTAADQSRYFPIFNSNLFYQSVSFGGPQPTSGDEVTVYTDYWGGLHGINKLGTALSNWERVDYDHVYDRPVLFQDIRGKRRLAVLDHVILGNDVDSFGWLQLVIRTDLLNFSVDEGVGGPSTITTQIETRKINPLTDPLTTLHGVVNRRSDNLMVLNIPGNSDGTQGSRILFVTSRGRQAGEVLFSLNFEGYGDTGMAIGDVVSNGSGVEEIVASGSVLVGGQQRSGIFLMDVSTSRPSIRPLYLLSQVPDPDGFEDYSIAYPRLGKVTQTAQLEIVVQKTSWIRPDDIAPVAAIIRSSVLLLPLPQQSRQTTVSPRAEKVFSHTIRLNDVSDLNQDGRGEIGFYNDNEKMIEYLTFDTQSKQLMTLLQLSSQTLRRSWSTANLLNDRNLEIIALEPPGLEKTPDGSWSWLSGRLKIADLNSKTWIRSYPLVGMPLTEEISYVPSLPALPHGTRIRLWQAIPAIDQFLVTEHQFLPQQSTLGWPVPAHDYRLTNNTQTPLTR